MYVFSMTTVKAVCVNYHVRKGCGRCIVWDKEYRAPGTRGKGDSAQLYRGGLWEWFP